MRVLPDSIVVSIVCALLIPLVGNGQESGGWEKERSAAIQNAEKAISGLQQVFKDLNDASFSEERTVEAVRIGRAEIPIGTPKINVLRQRIQFLIAQIDLAQDYPATKLKGQEAIDRFLNGRDYFGTSPAQNLEDFEKKQALVEKLFSDDTLQLGNRFFGLMQTGKDNHKITLSKWIKFVEKLSGPQYLGTPFEKQPTTLGRSLKGLIVLHGVSQSSDFKRALETAPDLNFKFSQVMDQKLRPATVKFARDRYVRGGMLRDWSLPVASAAGKVFPDLNRNTIGITTLANYQKTALSHARAVTQLIERIDDSSPSPKEVNRALQTIQFYRNQPYYIGSNEIREAGTLKVPAHRELEVILGNANFFAPDGNRNIKTYQKRSQHLSDLFTGEDSTNNLELLISLKRKEEWLKFFRERLFGNKNEAKSAVFAHIEKYHQITNEHLKVLFLARIILPSPEFQNLFSGDSVTEASYRDLMIEFGDRVKESSSIQFRNYPKEWINVQNGYLEIAKGFPNYGFERLKVTTSTDLAMVRKDFEEGLYGRESVAEEFLSLLLPDSPDVIPSIDQMTSPELSRRTGKFDSQLSPEFVNRVNGKLADILEYRSYGLAAIDSLDRPDLQVGRIMTHFAVSDYRLPGDTKTNTVMHDLICGPEGGFGGLGMIFEPDSKGYKERESVLDAIATSEELNLGEVLFHLAIDINRNNEATDEDLGMAARRWITYFRKSQANAQFHPVPEVMKQAVRGTFLSRLVFQSESFQRAMEISRNSPVGSPTDISYEFEAAVSAQIRKMQAMLSKIDPETATNRNIHETAEKWQDFKVWYLESTKWLEAIIDDPLLVGEVARVRKVNRKIADYDTLCPEVVEFKRALEKYSSSLYGKPEPPTLALAKFAMKQVTDLEPSLDKPLPDLEITPENEHRLRQLEFGKAVSNQFLADIRQVIADSGFDEIADITSGDELAVLYDNRIEEEARLNTADSSLVKDRAKTMETEMKAVIAKAISRVEADQPSDFKTLEGQAIRAAKVDRILSEGELSQYRIDIKPSIVMNEWINRDKVEVMANYRTLEVTAEARQMTNKAKAERRSMIEVQEELMSIKAQSLQKMELLQRWIDESGEGANVEVVMEEVIAMRQENAALKRENSNLRDSESLMRARAADFAQKLFHFKRGQKKDDAIELEAPEPLPEPDPSAATVAVFKKPTENPTTSRPSFFSGNRSNYNSSRRTPTRTTRRSPSRGGGVFQRLFGR